MPTCKCNISGKCANYLLCNSDECISVLKENNGLCIYCTVMHGKLNIKENIEDKCILCLDTNKHGIQFGTCDHYICIDCTKKKFIFDDCGETNSIFTVCAICN
jgi:hypothetical protein